jgi:hypothetical protein
MQEEQPNFKVTDRRLFNPDGSPRDLPPEEKPKPTAAEAPEAVAAALQISQAAEEAQATPEPEVAASVEQETPAPEDELSEEEFPDARDPASFINFLMVLAQNAASSLGMVENPVSRQPEVDLDAGKQWIDVLGMLQKKTAGNLTTQEHRMLEGLLGDLRMQYVSLVNSPQQPQRFTGSDITGGR